MGKEGLPPPPDGAQPPGDTGSQFSELFESREGGGRRVGPLSPGRVRLQAFLAQPFELLQPGFRQPVDHGFALRSANSDHTKKRPARAAARRASLYTAALT